MLLELVPVLETRGCNEEQLSIAERKLLRAWEDIDTVFEQLCTEEPQDADDQKKSLLQAQQALVQELCANRASSSRDLALKMAIWRRCMLDLTDGDIRANALCLSVYQDLIRLTGLAELALPDDMAAAKLKPDERSTGPRRPRLVE